MSLAEIKEAVTGLTPRELAELAAFIQAQDKCVAELEIEQDCSPEGKHREHLAKMDVSVSREDWPEFPVFDGGPVDGAINHDKYIYDEPAGISRGSARK